MVFKIFCVCVLWTKVASALEGSRFLTFSASWSMLFCAWLSSKDTGDKLPLTEARPQRNLKWKQNQYLNNIFLRYCQPPRDLILLNLALAASEISLIHWEFLFVQVSIKSIQYISKILDDMIQYWTFFDTENFPIQYQYLVSYRVLLFLPVFHQLFSVCCLPEVRDVPHWPYVIRHLNGHHQKLVPISTILTCVPSAFLCLLSSRGQGCPPLTVRDPPPQWPSPETGTYLYYSYLCSISFSLFAVFQRSGMSPTDRTWSATSMTITRNWYLSLLFLPVFHQLFSVCCLPEVRDVPHWPYVIRHLNDHHQKLVPISTLLTCVPSAFLCLLSSRGQGCPPLTVRDPPPQWPSPETGTYLYYSYLCSISFSLFAVFQRSGMSPTDRTWSATSMAITRNWYLSLLFLPVFHQLFSVCCLPEVRDVPHWPYVIRHLNGHHQKLVPISTILTCVPSAFLCLLSSRGQGCPPLTVRDPPPQWPSPETGTYLYYSYLCSISFSLFAVFQRSGMSPTDRTWSATSMAITRNWYLSLLFLPVFHQLSSVCCLPEVRDVPHWPYVIRHLDGHHQKLIPVPTILTCVPSASLCLLSSRGQGCPPLTVRDPPPQWPSPETGTYLYYSYLCSISFSLFAVFQRSGMSPTDRTWSATSMAITRNLSLLRKSAWPTEQKNNHVQGQKQIFRIWNMGLPIPRWEYI